MAFSKLNISLAILLILLGVIALIIGDKQETTDDQIALTFAEYDQVISEPIVQIESLQLAEMLMRQSEFYHLFDLTKAKSSYSIPTSEFSTIEKIIEKKIPVNELIILYSENEQQSIQAYYLLLIRGYFKIKILKGGLSEWRRQILYPTRKSIPTEMLKGRETISQFFGGQVVSSNTNQLPLKNVPIQLEKKVKKHQGC